jgi:hypothetical protein
MQSPEQGAMTVLPFGAACHTSVPFSLDRTILVLWFSADLYWKNYFTLYTREVYGLADLTSRLFESSWRGGDSNSPGFYWRPDKRRISVR